MKSHTFLLLLALAACREDALELEPLGADVVTGESVTGAEFYGRVVEESGEPVPGAIVRVGERFDTADAAGDWRIDYATVDADEVYFTVESPGHLHGSRTLTEVESEGSYEVGVTLLPLDAAGACSGGGPCVVAFAEAAARLDFPAGAFATADGPYADEVRVVAHYINPETDSGEREMPGDLRGERAGSGELVGLRSFGMVGVELLTPGGEEVFLTPGALATVRVPIPAALLAEAPAAIPLWHFDEGAGRWREEGEGRREGDAYVGEVSHFSFWNWDVAFAPVNLRMTLETAAGTPLASATVEIASETQGSRTETASSLGLVAGAVPAGEELRIRVTDACEQLVFDTLVGPLAADTDLGTLTAVASATGPVQLSGVTLACGGEPAQAGISVYQGSRVVAEFTSGADGAFAKTVDVCLAGELTVTAAHAVDTVTYAGTAYVDPAAPADTLAIEMCTPALDVDAITVRVEADEYTEIEPSARRTQTTVEFFDGDDAEVAKLLVRAALNAPADTLQPGFYAVTPDAAAGSVAFEVRVGATEYASGTGELSVAQLPPAPGEEAKAQLEYAGTLVAPDGSKFDARVTARAVLLE